MNSHKTVRRILAFTLLLGLGAFAGISYWSGSQIASPSRRALLPYHHEFLSQPGDHGMRIDDFTTSDGTPCLIVTPDPLAQLGTRGATLREQLEADGRKLKPRTQIHGTLVLVHGRKGRKEDYLPIAERLCAVGFRCIIPDMPAHGDHPHNLATYGIREANLPARVLQEAAERHAFSPQPAGLIGMSMGGSVAVHAAASDDARWRALVVISSFDALEPIIHGQAKRHAGPMLGSVFGHVSGWVYEVKSGMPLGNIRPHRHAAAIHIPTLIAHGTHDQVIPMSAGQKLFAALPDEVEKEWLEVPGADHDNVLITDFPIYAEITKWMLTHVPES